MMMLHRSTNNGRVARVLAPLCQRHLASSLSTSASAPSSDPSPTPAKPLYNYNHSPTTPNPDQALRSSTLSSHTPPPPPPPSTEKKKSFFNRGPGLGVFLKNAWKEYLASATQKINNPNEAWKDGIGENRPTVSTLSHQWNRFRQSIGFTLEPVSPFRQVLTFSPQTDLKQFTLLNDNSFGGSSTCTMDLKEYIAVDADGNEIKTYTIVFRGELRPLRSFQTSASRWVDDEARPAQLKNPISAATGGPQIVSTKPAPPANAPPASTLSSTPPSNKPAPSALQSTPPGAKPKLASSLSAANTTPIDRTAPGFNPFTSRSSSTPASATSPSSSSNNPFLTRTQPSINPSQSATADAEAPVSTFFRSPPPPSKKDPTLINGFAAFISPLYKYPDLDLDRYDFLSMQVRTDGRPYIFNVRCREGPTSSHGYVYQARIREETPRPMHKLEIRFENFICTQSGRMRSFGTSLPKDRIESFGFSVTGPEGPFEIEIESINAQTGTPDFELKARREALLVEERTKSAMVQQRLNEVAKRQAVAAELARLRKEKNQPEAEPEGGILRELAFRFANSDRFAAPNEVSEEDLKGFPAEVQQQMRADREQRLKQEAELKAKMQKELEKKKAEVATNTQSTTETPRSHPTVSPELEKEIRERVELEFNDGKDKEEVPVGDRGTKF